MTVGVQADPTGRTAIITAKGSHSVEDHFKGKDPLVREVYSRLLATLRKFGPIGEEPKKTSIHLTRSSALAGVQVRKSHLIVTIKSDRELDSPRIHKSERVSANRYHLEIKVATPQEIDTELRLWLKKAYELSGQIRGEKVILDRDLAELYGVETRVLVQAVKRNLKRFPADFMFQLTKDELEDWRSQSVTSNPKAKMSLRRAPYAFSEQGVAMLSSVLNSDRAIEVNIEIMRAFVRLREMLLTHKELSRKMAALEKKYDKQFQVVFEAIRQLMESPEKPRRRIGFHPSRE